MVKYYEVVQPVNSQELLDQIQDTVSHNPPAEWKIGGIVIHKLTSEPPITTVGDEPEFDHEPTDAELAEILAILGNPEDITEEPTEQPGTDQSDEPAELSLELNITLLERDQDDYIVSGTTSDESHHPVTLRVNTKQLDKPATATY